MAVVHHITKYTTEDFVDLRTWASALLHCKGGYLQPQAFIKKDRGANSLPLDVSMAGQNWCRKTLASSLATKLLPVPSG